MGRLNVLLIKMSSLGDVIHTLPALEEACQAQSLEVTWVVEPSFAEVASWHRSVKRVIPFPLRQMRKAWLSSLKSGQLQKSLTWLRDTQYDVVLDAQGLIKSAVLAKLARGKSYGLDSQSARESLASLGYDHKIHVPKGQHAVLRLRQLFSYVFDYPLSKKSLSYGLDNSLFQGPSVEHRAILFLHGTTWATKHWPLSYWKQLAQLVSHEGFQVLLPWGNEQEYANAKAIAEQPGVYAKVLDRLDLSGLAGLIRQVKGVVAVDTGLGHLAAALSVPCVSLYGPTNPTLTRTFGIHQRHLAATYDCAPCLKRNCPIQSTSSIKPPCFESIPPQKVWQNLSQLLEQERVQCA